MREKLLELMKREKLKPSQLAEKLGINPAGISHILSGRNNPSFELIQKILRCFPRINPDWLLLDSGEIYRDDAVPGEPASGDSASESEPTLPGIDDHTPRKTEIGTTPENTAPDTDRTRGGVASHPGSVGEFRTKASVQRIVIFYDDQTCECYFPTKR